MCLSYAMRAKKARAIYNIRNTTMPRISTTQSYKYNFVLYTKDCSIYGNRLEYIHREDIESFYNVYVGNFITARVSKSAIITQATGIYIA